MIVFNDVVARYPAAKEAAVKGITLEAPRGKVTAVAGPNGSGKSTLVRALLKRIPLQSGSIVLDGADINNITSRDFARKVAVVPQREENFFTLPVHEYVALGRFPHVGLWQSETSNDTAAVESALERAGVAELQHRSIDELSGGEWQRVRIARALAQGTEALVLDEPTTFMDVAHEMAMFELMDTLADSGMSVLLVSHQLNLVARFAASIVLLHQGKVVASGSPEFVMQDDTLEQVYEWPLVVVRDPASNAPALVPLRKRKLWV